MYKPSSTAKPTATSGLNFVAYELPTKPSTYNDYPSMAPREEMGASIYDTTTSTTAASSETKEDSSFGSLGGGTALCAPLPAASANFHALCALLCMRGRCVPACISMDPYLWQRRRGEMDARRLRRGSGASVVRVLCSAWWLRSVRRVTARIEIWFRVYTRRAAVLIVVAAFSRCRIGLEGSIGASKNHSATECNNPAPRRYSGPSSGSSAPAASSSFNAPATFGGTRGAPQVCGCMYS